jgi:hypothetical protein
VESGDRHLDDPGARASDASGPLSGAAVARRARVLSAGGGICGACDDAGYLAKDAEVFTPPYLCKKDGSGELAPRPVITADPETSLTTRRSRSPRPNPPRSPGSRWCGWAPSRTRSTWSGAICRCHSRRAAESSTPLDRPTVWASVTGAVSAAPARPCSRGKARTLEDEGRTAARPHSA